MKFTMVSTMISRVLNSKQVQQAGSKERGVSFGDVGVREYTPGLVDNPGVTSQLPIGLTGSKYTQREPVSVTAYEAKKTLDEDVPTWGDATTQAACRPFSFSSRPASNPVSVRTTYYYYVLRTTNYVLRTGVTNYIVSTCTYRW